MLSGLEFIQVDTIQSSQPPSRSLCNEGQFQTPSVCITQSGSKSNSDGRTIHRLEQMGEHLSVPSGQSANQGSSQVEAIQREDCTNSSLVAQEQLVSTPIRTQTPSTSYTQSQTKPIGTEKDCLSFIKSDKCVTFMDFLKFAEGHRWGMDPENVEFHEAYKKDSTQKQYNSAFKKFTDFIKERNPEVMTLNVAMSFFKFLHDKGLAPATINTIRSALVKILWQGFKIDLNENIFTSVPKACALLKPPPRPKPISWSLNKVLKLASDLKSDTIPFQKLLQKTIFF